jgi:translation initiation factor 2 beta subunit (eIF-2beta)/eIF-5
MTYIANFGRKSKAMNYDINYKSWKDGLYNFLKNKKYSLGKTKRDFLLIIDKDQRSGR